MELIDRYLHAVRFWLPRKSQDDILAELTEDIHSQMEEKESELGHHPLTESEVADILKRRGHPMLVAIRYLPQQHLIGPAFFPVYLWILRLVLLWVMVPIWLAVLAPIAFLTSEDSLAAAIGVLAQFPHAAITAFGVITLVFAVLERVGATVKCTALENWDPRKLPRITTPPPHAASRATCVNEMVGALIWTWVWVFIRQHQFQLQLPGLDIALTVVWSELYWPILFVLAAGVPLGLIGLVRPRLATLRASLRLALCGAGLALVGVLLRAGVWVEISSPRRFGETIANANHWANVGIQVSLSVVAVLIAIAGFQEIRRLMRHSRVTAGSVLAAR